MRFVVVVVVDDRDIPAEAFHDLSGDRCLAAAGTPGYPDNNYVISHKKPPEISLLRFYHGRGFNAN
jgi:hypothetical protein